MTPFARARLSVALVALVGCSADETGLGLGEERVSETEPGIERELIRLTQEITLDRREESGASLVNRFNQPKSVACLDAEFVVGALPEPLAVGLFGTTGTYPARLRLANATQFDDREADLRGLSVKVFDVPGAVSVGGEPGVQDFTLNNYPALFAGTPEDFLDFVESTANGRTWAYFVNPLDPHLYSLMIVLRARSQPDSPFSERYFSTTPYRYGEGTSAAVKYSVEACEPVGPVPIDEDDPDYLRAAVAHELGGGPACLNFMVQFQADPDRMPIEDASVIWSEDISPFHKVAEIRIPPQSFDGEAEMGACEAMRFNPWNGLRAHEPLGGINRVRKNLYEELGRFRAEQNVLQE